MVKRQEKPSDEDIQSNLDALNRTYETYNGTASRVTQLAAEQSFYIYHRWLVERGVQFYLDAKSQKWKLGVSPQGNTRPLEEGGNTSVPLWCSFLTIIL